MHAKKIKTVIEKQRKQQDEGHKGTGYGNCQAHVINYTGLLYLNLLPSVQFSSVIQSCPTLCDPMDCSTPASLSFSISWSLLKVMSIELVMSSNHLILCCPLLLPPSIFPSIRVFSNESALCIRWPKYWSFSFSISPSNDIQD